MVASDKTSELTLFSINESAKQLKVGKKRIYDMIEKGEIGVIELDTGTIRIPQCELTRWVQERIVFNAIKQSPENGIKTRQSPSFNAQSAINKIIRRNCHNE